MNPITSVFTRFQLWAGGEVESQLPLVTGVGGAQKPCGADALIDILKRVQKYPIKFFYGPMMQLNFDLERYGWPRSVSLLQYSTKDARGWLSNLDKPVIWSNTRRRGFFTREHRC